MAKGLIWTTAEDLAKNRATVLSLYRQILRSLNSPDLPLTHAARLAKKAEVRTIFLFGSEERSLHNIADLIDAACYSLSILKKVCKEVTDRSIMDLDSIKDAFDRVAKKQKLMSTKTQDLVDQVGKEIEQAILKIQDDAGCSDHAIILTELSNKLKEMAPMNQLEAYCKEINIVLMKYIKFLEKLFNPDISKAYRNVDFDIHIVNEIVATHFYRQGLFDLGDCFVKDSNESQASSLKCQFEEMYSILDAMKSSKNLESAINWAAKHGERLSQNGSCLELKLHQLQFIEILKREGSRDEALKYARIHLAPFAPVRKVEIQKLMACLLWAGRLDQSPYSNLISTTHWDNLSEEFTHQFCSILGHSCENPLSMVVDAGVQALPTLLKMAMVMASKKHEWDNLKQLPVPVDLRREFQFHSVFVCPVLREQGSDENPPMLMPCGHVLSKQSIVKLSKSGTRMFKCPYCPEEAAVSQCRQIHF